LIQGSFGAPSNNSGQPPNVFRNLTVSRFTSTATSATSEEGTEIRGIMWNCNFHDWTITSTTQRVASGDVGAIYGHISGNFYNIYKNGGPGYIVRAFPSSEVGKGDSINIWNCGKFNGTEYGTILLQEDPSDSVAGKFGNVSAVNVYNISAINCATNITYWCQVVITGIRGWPRYQLRNLLGINLQTTGKPEKIVYNQGEAWPTFSVDVTNNVYFNSATEAFIDSTTTFITNILGSFPKYIPTASSLGILHLATVNPLSNIDFAGVIRGTQGDIGYRQYMPGNSNVLLFKIGLNPKFSNP
jgi:hypothetical protein